MDLGSTDLWVDLAAGAGWVPDFAYHPDRGAPRNTVRVLTHPDGWTLGLEGTATGFLEGLQSFGRYVADHDDLPEAWAIGDPDELAMAVVCRVPPARPSKLRPGRLDGVPDGL